MKGQLIFNLPEEDEQFQNAVKAGAYRGALEDIANEVFRRRRKYMPMTEDQARLLEEMEKEFYEIINNHDVEVF